MPLLCSDGRTGCPCTGISRQTVHAVAAGIRKGGPAVCRSFNGAATAAAVSDDEGMERVRGEQKVIRALVPPPQPQLFGRSLKIHPGPFQWRRGGEWGRRNESSHLEILLWRDEGRGRRRRGEETRCFCQIIPSSSSCRRRAAVSVG